MNNIEIISKRTSVRSFKSDSFKDKDLDKVLSIVYKTRVCPNGNQFSFTLLNTESDDLQEIGKMSSYGVIKGAKYYIVGSCLPDNDSVIDYGYALEEVILELTELGLGTCWLGGTFSRGYIAKAIELSEGKIIPAITPVGYPMEKQQFNDKLVRFIAKSDKRKANKQLFTGDLVGEEPYKTFLEMVKIGPSASNKQPWRVVVEDKAFHLFWDFDEKYNGAINSFNIQALDMGIALCHLKLTSESLDLKSTILDRKLDSVNNWNYVSTLDLL